MNLSKSQYTRALQCFKSLWLYKHRRELQTPPNAAQQARFDAGHEVGELAQQLFPGGVEIEFDSDNFPAMLAKTTQYLKEGVTTIYEASFSRAHIFAACDILHLGPDGWEIYEVKSSTSVKPYHLEDVAIQWYVLNKAGLQLSKAAIVHVNSDYVRQGDIDIHDLFTVNDVTDVTIERQPGIPDQLASIKDMLSDGEPDIEIGTQCTNPYDCSFKDYCWKEVPERSVLNLYRINGEKKFRFYNDGIVELKDLPADYKANTIQQLQLQANQSKEPVIDKQVIASFLDTLVEPLYYLDFETFQNAVPRFDSQSPYQQIPFQYSLHTEHGGIIEHIEYLADEKNDPRKELAERLVRDLGKAGTIVAFNMGFEKGVIKRLAQLFPELSEQLLLLNERFVDLVNPFRQGGYYDEKMNGSFSIKAILPALFPDDPDLSYKSLVIQDGNMASETFANLYKNEDPEAVSKIRDALLAYCRLDTLAMVKIVHFLRQLINESG